MFFYNITNFRKHDFKLGCTQYNIDNSLLQDKFNYNMFFSPHGPAGGKHSFHSSPITLSNSNLKLILDNSKNKSIINRENGLYKVYRNIYLNDKVNFINNLIEVLEDLYDNNEFTVFHLYFFIIPSENNMYIDFNKLMIHLNKFPIEYIMNEKNITKFYKNIGLIFAINILVFTSIYDIENLSIISRDIKLDINNSIKVINANVYKDLDNTIINFNTKLDVNSEIMLVIKADFDTMASEFND